MFQSEQLFIRPYKTSDAEAVLKTIGNYQIYRTTYGIQHPCDIKYVKKWIKNILANASADRAYEYAIINKKTRAYMGNVGLINIDHKSKRCDISYFIDPLYQNHGIATEASAVMIRYAFDQLGMIRVGGMCMENNNASAKVMEKLHMTYEGTLRNYFIKDNAVINAKMYSILAHEYQSFSRNTI